MSKVVIFSIGALTLALILYGLLIEAFVVPLQPSRRS